MDYWVKIVKDIFGESPVYGLAGNKKGLFLKDQIDEDTGRIKAQEIGALFKFTSAKRKRKGKNDFMKELLDKYLNKKWQIIKRPRAITIERHIDESKGDKHEK